MASNLISSQIAKTVSAPRPSRPIVSIYPRKPNAVVIPPFVEPAPVTVPPTMPLQPLQVAQEVPLTSVPGVGPASPEEALREAISRIQIPVNKAQIPASSVSMPEYAPPPVFDESRLDDRLRKSAEYASIISALGTLGGSTAFGSKAALGFLGGGLKGAQDQGQLELGRDTAMVNGQNALRQEVFGNDLRLLGEDNRSIERANDNARQLYGTQVDDALRGYDLNLQSIAGADRRKNEEAKRLNDLEELKLKQAREKRMETQNKLSGLMPLIRTNRLTPSGEEEVSNLLNEIYKTGGFSPDFLQDLDPATKRRLDELSLDRKSREGIAKDRITAQKEMVQQRITANASLNQSRINAAAARQQIDGTLRKELARTSASMKAQVGQYPKGGDPLSVVRATQGLMTRASIEANQYERQVSQLHAQILSLRKSKDLADDRGTNGFTEAGNKEFMRLQAALEAAAAKAEQKHTEYAEYASSIRRIIEASPAYSNPEGAWQPPAGQVGAAQVPAGSVKKPATAVPKGIPVKIGTTIQRPGGGTLTIVK